MDAEQHRADYSHYGKYPLFAGLALGFTIVLFMFALSDGFG